MVPVSIYWIKNWLPDSDTNLKKKLLRKFFLSSFFLSLYEED